MTTQTGGLVGLEDTEQYEPYYLDSSYVVSRDESKRVNLDRTTTAYSLDNNRNRDSGYQKSLYNATKVVPGEDFL
jgi:hypothetical protein